MKYYIVCEFEFSVDKTRVQLKTNDPLKINKDGQEKLFKLENL
jgi:hypothetical protein